MPSIYYKQQTYAMEQEKNQPCSLQGQTTLPIQPDTLLFKGNLSTPLLILFIVTWYVSIFWPYVWLAKCWPSIVTLLLVAHVVLKSSFVTFALEVFRYALCKCSSLRLSQLNRVADHKVTKTHQVEHCLWVIAKGQ